MDLTDKRLEEYMDGLVQSIIEGSERLKNLDEEQKKQASEKIRNKLDDLALETLFNRLSDDEIESIRSLVGKPELDEKIEELASTIPGLAEDLGNRLEREVAFIKNSMS